ncbi:Mitochondrial inner membrane protein oxa1l [Entophlyctis luteolus]|nr:Mitochondrial inner membrane protein oxa1l [Entophlyctis luteolus]
MSAVRCLMRLPLRAPRRTPCAHSQSRSFLFSRSILNPTPSPSPSPSLTLTPTASSHSPAPPIQSPNPPSPPTTSPLQTLAVDSSPSPAIPDVSSPASQPLPVDAPVPKPTESLLDPSLSSDFVKALDSVIVDPAKDIVGEASEPLLTAITNLGDIKTLGLGHWTPVGLIENLIEGVYVTTGMPWWATIAVTTIALRFALLPFVLKSQRAAAEMANLKPILGPLQAEMRELQVAGADLSRQRVVMKKIQDVYAANGLNPFAGMWGLVQAPVFMSAFLGLRAMAELPVPGFTSGGIFWFHDLSVMDPMYILPIVATGTMLVVMEASSEAQVSGATNASQMNMMKKVFRTLILVSLPFTCTLPAAIFVYWVTSNFLTLLQFYMLKDARVRKILSLPEIKQFPKFDAKGTSAASTGITVSGVTAEGLLAVKPMKFGEAWRLAKDEADRRKKAAIPLLK